jgi:tetratricopeptide (TPR) repeat protein
MRPRFLFLVLAVSAAACQKVGSTSEKQSAAGKAAALSAPVAALETARRLAVAPTKEATATDRRILALSKLAAAQPRRADVFVELGRTWAKKARESSDPGYYVNADACVDVALDLSPDDKGALDLRAMVLLNAHEFRRARDVANSILARDPEMVSAWGSLSDALLEIGELEEADRAAQKMMELKPSLSSYSRVSYFQWLAGNEKGAIESARLAIDAGGDPANAEPRAWAIVQAAMIFWHRGDYAGADAGFTQALEVVHDYPPALVGRGRVALAHQASAEAARYFERAYRASPLVETAWLLGEARERAGDAEGARAAFAEAEKEGKGGDRRTLSLMYSTRNTNAEDALRLAEREHTTRGDIYTEDALAWALYRNGLFEDAKAAIERARRYGTKDARLLYHEGAIETALGRREAGKKLAQAAIALNPEFDPVGATEARALARGR